MVAMLDKWHVSFRATTATTRTDGNPRLHSLHWSIGLGEIARIWQIYQLGRYQPGNLYARESGQYYWGPISANEAGT